MHAAILESMREAEESHQAIAECNFSLLSALQTSRRARCVYNPHPRHQTGPRAYSKVEPDLYLIYGMLVSLHGLCQTRLPYRVFNRDKLCASFVHPPETRKLLRNTVNERLYWLVYSRQTCLGQAFCSVWNITSLPGCRQRHRA